MFGRRRRPLLRAAAVGGAGYALGKRRANVEAEDEAQDEAQDAELDDQPGLGDDSIDALAKLGDLKERGILTQQEFDEQKARILDGS